MSGYGWYHYKGSSRKKVEAQIPSSDRAKSGTKRSMVVVDGKGVPLV